MIGILLLDTSFPRLLGDVGNPETFPFPVIYERIEGAIPLRVVKERDEFLLSSFIEGAKVLQRRGAKAVTTSCGFLAIWQKEIASAVDIPVFTSSLLQVPLAYQISGRRGRIGILTVDAASLTEAHFEGVGAIGVPVVVRGLNPASEFHRVYVGNHPNIDLSKAENEMVAEVSALVNGHPDVSGLVLECANMPVFGKAVRKAVSVPVFDTVTLTNYIWSGILK
ncbi:MAG: aspartate/glutamate racemase family protein [Syntrophaceae bacterium]|nr:aspartate/glutamate racemase family protein [Syntrophaceae bacterium]